MSTHATIAVQTDACFAHVYVHYDGYPQHMIPALEGLTDLIGLDELCDFLLNAKECRSVTTTEVEGFPHPRAFETFERPTKTQSYLYVHNGEHWEVK